MIDGNRTPALVFRSQCLCRYDYAEIAAPSTRVFNKRRPFAQVSCRDVGWAVVDVDFAADAKFLVYST